MPRELRTARLVMMTEPSLLRRVDDWRRPLGIDSRAAAVRELVERGLSENESPAAAATAPGSDQSPHLTTDRSNDERT